jgi:hypothetical protein
VKLEFRKAKRRAVPILMSISGLGGSGKTYSALKVAAGIAGKDGRVAMIDTENGRGEMYEDSPGIMAVLPDGFDYLRLDPPFSPKAYIEAVTAAELAKMTVCIVDSGSHEWEGIDGCCEIAEKNKLRGMPNWAKAKMEHKRFINHCLSSSMNLIFCLRAREKVKMVPAVKNGKSTTEVVPIGIQPIAEKGFVHEMMISLGVDEVSHFAVPLKVPEPLERLFPEATLLTEEHGIRIREWNQSAPAQPEFEQLGKRAKAEAGNGLASYKAYFKGLTKPEQLWLSKHGHEEYKMDAQNVDAEAAQAEGEEL